MALTMAACGNTASASGGPVEAGVIVEKCDGLADGFIMGADVSSLLAEEASGVIYRDFDGNEADCLAVMASAGVNYIRVRVWNDPFDADGNGYGGGNCDIQTAVILGQRAAKYGMGLLVDLHYSDFWADPAKQMAPKAWADMGMEEKTAAVYDYTAACLKTLSEAGVEVGMIQIGNETTTGFCGETSVPRVMKLMASAAQAVRDTAPDTLICVHYTNPEDGDYSLLAATLDVNGVDYDVFASSYYPYWHGTLENLTKQLALIAEKYGKKVMVAETSYAYTLEDADGSPNTIGEQLTYEKKYPFTVQGQTTAIADLITAVASIGDAALGVFYWEPAWITVPGDTYEERSALWEEYGSGWASSWASEYDPDDAGVYYGGSAVDNQALFDSDGNPLESLKVFSYIRTGAVCALAVDSVEPVYLTVKLNNPITLPETVTAVYNDGSTAEVEVLWGDVDLDAMSASAVGTYEVPGTAGGKEVSCFVSMVDENYVENYSFEDADCSMWRVDDIASAVQTDFQVKKTDAFSGTTSLHFWNADAVEFSVEQDCDGLRPGVYKFSIEAQGGDVGEDAVMYIYAVADGVRYEQAFAVNGWVDWQNPVVEGIVCETGSVTVGVYIKTAGGGWGTLDDFLLNPDGT